MAAEFGGVTGGVIAGVGEDLGAGFLGGESGDAGWAPLLGTVPGVCDVRRTVVPDRHAAAGRRFGASGGLLGGEAFQLLVDNSFAFRDALFKVVEFQSPARLKLFGVIAELLDLLVGQEAGFAGDGIGVASRLRSGGFGRGPPSPCASGPTRVDADKEKDRPSSEKAAAAHEKVDR